jgi:hypothetical protein
MRRTPQPRLKPSRLLLALAVSALLLAAVPISAQQQPAPELIQPAGPPKPPATRPAEPRAAMAKAFADLAHSEAAAREAARIHLMGMSRQDLPPFEQIVRENLPLAPSQANALKEIAVQVYLAGDEYVSSTRDGFLGVRLGEVNVISNAPEGGKEQEPRQQQARVEQPQFNPNPFDLPPPGHPATTAVVIMERMAGFCGARMFQDGDVVLGIAAGRRHLPIRTPLEMKTHVQHYGAGQTVLFEVLRQGQVQRVPVMLDPKPDEADPTTGINAMQNMLDRRRTTAEEYWEKTFAPLLKEKVG